MEEGPFPILSFASELVGQIFRQLCHHCTGADRQSEEAFNGKRALVNLCLTSKAIRDHALPVLYHSGCIGRRFDLFTHSLAANPALRQHVRAVHLKGVSCVPYFISSNVLTCSSTY